MAPALNETAVKEPTMLDGAMAMEPTPRVNRLKEDFLRAKPVIEIDHARIYTRTMKETEGEPMVIRRAKAFCTVVREMPINIVAEELFAGYVNATWAGHQVAAERGASIEGALDYMLKKGRSLDAEDERELREDILPYWKAPEGQSRSTQNHEVTPFLSSEIGQQLFYGGRRRAGQYGHLIINYEKVLKKGFLGVKRDAEERLARLDTADPEELRKVPFLTGVLMAMEAAAEIGMRFAARARQLAAEAEDAGKKAALLKLAEVCDRVPANPARTFHEALQSVWFAYILQNWEAITNQAYAVARSDQYLYPYYEKDIAEGRITRAEAQELIDCWLLRFNIPDWTTDFDEGHQRILGDPSGRTIGGMKGCHLSVGGYKADGSDGTNELTYMFIEGMMHLGLPEPYFSVQVHSRMRDDLLIKACQLTSLGYGHPQFENADVLVPGIVTRGTGGPPITMEEARGFASVGCQEPMLAGIEGLNPSGIINGALALELALNNGVSRLTREQSGLKTGDPRQFSSFEDLREAYKKQFALLTEKATLMSNIRELNIAEKHPTVFISAMMEDCIEKGTCREEGGARHNAGPGLYAIGLPDNADSFAAIKKLVFEEKKITMTQLCDALDSNFEGHEDLRKMCLESPKYGNDVDYVDEQMVWLAREWAAECRKQKNPRGGNGVPGMQAYVTHIPYGRAVGALPSGRLAGKPLSDGASPCPGSDVHGPTAVFKSLSKVNGFEQNMTNILNMTLDPAVFKDKNGVKRLADLMRTFVDEKIQEVQFNVISPDTLRAAQKEPDQYQGLAVKVAGYSAFFTQLSKPLQDAIISRTDHGL